MVFFALSTLEGGRGGFFILTLLTLPLLLGWLVLVPVTLATLYTSYRDVYLS